MKAAVILSICVIASINSITPALSGNVKELLDDAADRYGMPREIVHAIAMVESTEQCGVKNGPSRGIMQVQKGTAKEVGIPWPFQSCWDEIQAGVRYLKKVTDKGGKNCFGFTLYNEGINAPHHCSNYGRKVMQIINQSKNKKT